MSEKFRDSEVRPGKELTGKDYDPNNSPGNDAFDSSMIGKKLIMPGSNVNEGASSYYEHKGPNDLVRRHEDDDDALTELDPEVHIKEGKDVDLIPRDERDGDEADRWLKANDPDRKK